MRIQRAKVYDAPTANATKTASALDRSWLLLRHGFYHEAHTEGSAANIDSVDLVKFVDLQVFEQLPLVEYLKRLVSFTRNITS